MYAGYIRMRSDKRKAVSTVNMKAAGRKMGIMMGLSMSFLLSLIGTLSSGSFSAVSFLMSFFISFLISFTITSIVPMKQITDSLVQKNHMKPGELRTRLFETLIMDLMLSPLMTLIMVSIAHRQATAHGASIPFGSMLLRSEIISFIAAYILIFILTPVFTKIAMKGAGPQK